RLLKRSDASAIFVGAQPACGRQAAQRPYAEVSPQQALVLHAMQRAFIGGGLLLLCGAIVARAKTDPLLFVFLRIDHERGVAILRPMIAPDVGVQLDSGPRRLEPGAVLACDMVSREHDAIVEGQLSKISEMVLDCGEHKFVV